MLTVVLLYDNVKFIVNLVMTGKPSSLYVRSAGKCLLLPLLQLVGFLQLLEWQFLCLVEPSGFLHADRAALNGICLVSLQCEDICFPYLLPISASHTHHCSGAHQQRWSVPAQCPARQRSPSSNIQRHSTNGSRSNPCVYPTLGDTAPFQGQ